MRSWWRDPRAYIGVAVLGFSVILILDFLWPAAPLGPAYLADVIATLVLLAVIVLWLGCRTTARLSRAQLVFLGATFAAWVVISVLALTRLPATPRARRSCSARCSGS